MSELPVPLKEESSPKRQKEESPAAAAGKEVRPSNTPQSAVSTAADTASVTSGPEGSSREATPKKESEKDAVVPLKTAVSIAETTKSPFERTNILKKWCRKYQALLASYLEMTCDEERGMYIRVKTDLVGQPEADEAEQAVERATGEEICAEDDETCAEENELAEAFTSGPVFATLPPSTILSDGDPEVPDFFAYDEKRDGPNKFQWFLDAKEYSEKKKQLHWTRMQDLWIFLCMVRTGKVRSPKYEGYIHSLPGEFLDPTHWSETEQETYLCGTNLLLETKRIVALMKQQVDEILWPKFGITLENWLWARSVYVSRAFPAKLKPGASVPVMVPLVDVFNHEHQYPVKVCWVGKEEAEREGEEDASAVAIAESTVNQDKSAVTSAMNAAVGQVTEAKTRSAKEDDSRVCLLLEKELNHDLEPGMEVFNNYGSKGNEELLLAYGFCIEANKFDRVQLQITSKERETAKAEAVYESKLAVLAKFFDTWINDEDNLMYPRLSLGSFFLHSSDCPAHSRGKDQNTESMGNSEDATHFTVADADKNAPIICGTLEEYKEKYRMRFLGAEQKELRIALFKEAGIVIESDDVPVPEDSDASTKQTVLLGGIIPAELLEVASIMAVQPEESDEALPLSDILECNLYDGLQVLGDLLDTRLAGLQDKNTLDTLQQVLVTCNAGGKTAAEEKAKAIVKLKATLSRQYITGQIKILSEALNWVEDNVDEELDDL